MRGEMKSLQAIIEKCEKTGAWYGEKIESIHQRNHLDDTVLHTVCSWGDANAVRLLIAAGADVNAKGDQGATPLFNAVIGMNAEVVKLLLVAGCDETVKNSYGRLCKKCFSSA
jgi:ankyrin repeat protein